MNIYSDTVNNWERAERGAWLLPQREGINHLRKAGMGGEPEFRWDPRCKFSREE